jgi:hypothetical protein
LALSPSLVRSSDLLGGTLYVVRIASEPLG